MNEQQTIETVRAQFAAIQRVDPCGDAYPQICAFLDAQDDDALKGLAGAGIKWISKLAINRCVTRGLVA